MAHEEHVALLRQGVETWNAWRWANSDVRRDLSGAYFSGANLSFADLSHADLSEARLGGTTVVTLDLSTVKGLETIKHISPSSIGIDTIYRSNATIPDSFLRGAGVSDTFIEYMRSLVVKPIDFYSVFISYSSHDQELAERLHADLQAARVRCWYAPHDRTPGEWILSGIDKGIRLHDKMLLLLSEASVRSSWVAHEVEAARTRELQEKRTVLYPVRLDSTVLESTEGRAAALRARHIGDFHKWKQHDEYKQVFQRLLRDLTKTDDRSTSQV